MISMGVLIYTYIQIHRLFKPLCVKGHVEDSFKITTHNKYIHKSGVLCSAD